MVTITSHDCLIEGHLVNIVDEVPKKQDARLDNTTAGDFNTNPFNSLEIENIRELYPIIQEEVAKKIIRKDSSGKSLKGYCQPEAIKTHLDSIPGMKELLSGESADLEYSSSRAYVRWVLWQYSFCAFRGRHPSV